MLLSSAGRREEAGGRDLGVAAWLTKPVKQSSLLDAIMTALGPGCTAEEPGAAPAAAEAGRPLRLLLAEDTPVNQKLAVTLLEKRGHHVTVVGTGRAAVEAVEKEPFDAVLMDVQMPEMDGLEAAAAVREREKGTGRHVPIIAMTAHAMKGDKERCLAAGMDGYVSKPIRARELFAALERLAAPAAPPPAPEPAPGPALDEAEALGQAGGDAGLLAELADIFLGECPGMLDRVRQAVRTRDARGLREAAHSLGGSVSNFGAHEAKDAAWRLEEMGKAGDLGGAEEALAALEQAVRRVEPVLARLRAAAPAS
jgi:CheY-like chemotaxis protein/HPt (histidine-containing phosphotransfer) domain-containing protein